MAGKDAIGGKEKEHVFFALQKRCNVSMGVQLQAVLITQDKHLFASHPAAGAYSEWTVSGISGRLSYRFATAVLLSEPRQ